VNEALKSDEAKASYAAQGFDLLGGGPQEFAHAIASDTALDDRGAGGGAEEVARRRLVARFPPWPIATLHRSLVETAQTPARQEETARIMRKSRPSPSFLPAHVMLLPRSCRA